MMQWFADDLCWRDNCGSKRQCLVRFPFYSEKYIYVYIYTYMIIACPQTHAHSWKYLQLCARNQDSAYCCSSPSLTPVQTDCSSRLPPLLIWSMYQPCFPLKGSQYGIAEACAACSDCPKLLFLPHFSPGWLHSSSCRAPKITLPVRCRVHSGICLTTSVLRHCK